MGSRLRTRAARRSPALGSLPRRRRRGGKAEEARPEAEVQLGAGGVSVAMETGRAGEPRSAEPGSYALGGATATPAPRPAGSRGLGASPRPPPLAGSEAPRSRFGARARRAAPCALQPPPEPHPLRVRPASLRSQDISHLLCGLFRGLYAGEVIGEHLSANLIKARGSEHARHEAFVDELRRVSGPGAPRGGRGGPSAHAERRVPTGPSRWTDACPCRALGPGGAVHARGRPCLWRPLSAPTCTRTAAYRVCEHRDRAGSSVAVPWRPCS